MSWSVEILTNSLNVQLTASLILLFLLALRPVTNRLITPQQRCVLWVPAMLMFFVFSSFFWMKFIPRLPVTLMDLITPQGSWSGSAPPFLPQYRGTGWYTLSLPGGRTHPFAVSDWAVTALCALWLMGMAGIIALLLRQESRGWVRRQRSEHLPWDDPRLAGIERVERVCVYLYSGLETSYVERRQRGSNRYTIFLQRELPPERLALVLRHELEHIRLCHCPIKFVLTLALVFSWWNPLVWAAYRCACRDMEEACDRAALEKLQPEQRQEYVRTLEELGPGRLMWDAPLCLGECGTAFRVRRAERWKPAAKESVLLGLGLTAVLFAFCYGPPHPERVFGAAMAEDWQDWQAKGVETVLKWADEEGFQPGPLFLCLDEAEEVVYIRLQDTKTGTWHYRMFQWDYTREEHFTSNSWGTYAQTPDFEGYQQIGPAGRST